MGSGRIIHLPRNVRQRSGSKQLLIDNVFKNTPAKQVPDLRFNPGYFGIIPPWSQPLARAQPFA
jgi:hypothetical protein